MKVCSCCKIEKNESEFHKRKDKKDGLRADCKKCRSKKGALYRMGNLEDLKKRKKKSDVKNRENISARGRKYYSENREILLKKAKEYGDNNKEKISEVKKLYHQKNKEKIRDYKREYIKNRRSNDVNYRLKRIISCRIRNAIIYQYGERADSTINLLGCNIPEARIYLESKFKEGMSWENSGKWEIDHIKPCASFDLTDHGQQKKCFHYTNLQPLWASENRIKSNKFSE